MKSNPGDVISPCLYDPFAAEDDELQWERIENMNVTLEDVARAETDDVEALKNACGKGQLRGKGIGCFITHNGSTTFKQGTREECLAAKKPKQGATLYILKDPNESVSNRMMKCVVGEGLPTFRDQTEFGNLFLVLTIQFPDTIPADSISTLRGILPPPLNTVTAEEGDNVDVVFLEDADPVASFNRNKPKVAEEDDDDAGGPGMQGKCPMRPAVSV